MVEAKKSEDIGMKRGKVLCNLSHSGQLDIIAEGLPILMRSAGELLEASTTLAEHNRGAAILEGHAVEEVAKILILVDIVRCPQKLRPSRIGSMMTWFYDHLARLIYIDAQSWKPMNVKQLQEYVDDSRRSHSLEGMVGEYILPNWTTWPRESLLYADIVTYEDGEPAWNEPDILVPELDCYSRSPWRVCQALRDVGAFTRDGLEILSSVWSQTEFKDSQDFENAGTLTGEMLLALDRAGLVTDAADTEQVGILYDQWQMPMYHIEFSRIGVSLDELKTEQNARLWSEIGFY